MLNCKQASELMSQRMERNLGRADRLRLRFHLMMCGGCRNFGKQMRFLREASRNFLRKE